MEVRVRFASEIYIKGENMEEIRQKWENLPLYSAEALDCYADFIETEFVEYEDTGKPVSSEDFPY